MKTLAALLLLIGVGAIDTLANEPISLDSLLDAMRAPDTLCRWPQPAYQQLQASSYNLASKRRGGPGWFADSDGVGFIRSEQHDGRTEWVLMEHEGPGCITRIWTPFFYYDFNERTGPNVRIYLDGANEPVIDCPLIELVRAKQFIGAPFSAHTARAGDLYLPVAFASGCKVTMLRKPFYNIITYRAYPEGTRVETFTVDAFKAARRKLAAAGQTLLHPPPPSDDRLKTVRQTIAAGKEMTIPVPRGSAAVRYLAIELTPVRKDSTAYLRSTVLTARFDGALTVWCPVGDFFGSADAIHAFKTFAREVTADGTMICRWVMPYGKSAELKLRNLGSESVEAQVRVLAGPWQWDDRSMHFHANWRADGRVPTRADEFSHPFLSNIRVGGLDGRTLGFNICTRQRGLDAIPFTSRLRFDMEASFGVDIRNPWNLLGYSAVTWWYARPGSTDNRPPLPKEAARSITTLAELQRQSNGIRDGQTRRVEGALEMEDLRPTAQSEGLSGHRQVPHARFHPNRFSGRAHYFMPGRRAGDFVEFTIPEQHEPRRVVLHLVRSFDFGIVQLSVNGRRVGQPIDLYESDPATITKVDLGEIAPVGNTITLRVELVGSNPKSRGSGSFFGLDCVELK